MRHNYSSTEIKQVFSKNPADGMDMLESVCLDKGIFLNEWYAFKSQWSTLEQNVMLNLINYSDASVERSRLNLAFIKLTDKVFGGYSPSPAPQNDEPRETIVIGNSINPNSGPNSPLGKVWGWLNYEDQKEVLIVIGGALLALLSYLLKGG